jgi:hypothetical protein
MKRRLLELRKILHLSMIPEDVKEKLRLLGRGVTSIVFDKDRNFVIMVTVDKYKSEWLIGTGLAKFVKSFDIYIPSLKRFENVDVLKVEKLEPLSKENQKVVKNFIRDFFEERNRVLYDPSNKSYFENHFKNIKAASMKAAHVALINLSKKYRNKFAEVFDSESMIDYLSNWLMNFDLEKIRIDFHTKNFMQDRNEKIVIVDPIISEEYLKVVWGMN